MRVDCQLISGASNTSSRNVVWGIMKDNLTPFVAYGISNLLCIVDTSSNTVLATLRGHEGDVNMLSCIKTINGEGVLGLVSCGTEGTVRVWVFGEYLCDFESCRAIVLKGFSGPVVAVQTLSCSLGTVVVGVDDKGTALLWSQASNSNEFNLIRTWKFPTAQLFKEILLISLNLDVTVEDSFLLLFGSVDGRIRTYHLKYETIFLDFSSESFPHADQHHNSNNGHEEINALTGHDDWITCMCSAEIINSQTSLSNTPTANSNIENNSGSNVISHKKYILFASGSQDSKIRLWKIAPSLSELPLKASDPNTTLPTSDKTKDTLKVFENMDEDEEVDEEGEEAAPVVLVEEGVGDVRAEFVANGRSWTISLEALLVGHEDWVTAVHWIPQGNLSNNSTVPDSARLLSSRNLRLFSTSMDRNMIIWTEDSSSGVWLPLYRMGDIGGSLGGSIGGNLIGFVGGCVHPCGESVLGVGFGGAFHLWRCFQSADESIASGGETALVKNIDTSFECNQEERWRPEPFLTGHFNEVTDLCWHPDPSNPCLVTVSRDQTARLFAPIHPSSGEDLTTRATVWKEISRPQIHGYDMNAVALGTVSWLADSLANGTGSGGMQTQNQSNIVVCRLYSGSDEKIVRVLEVPVIVEEGLKKLCKLTLTRGSNESSDSSTAKHIDTSLENKDSYMPIYRAYLPELGLSAKAASLMTTQEQQEQAARGVSTLAWERPPLEGQLADHTLWPEVRKLFGHNGDVICLSLSKCGRWMATSCKARDAVGAIILVWDTERLTCIARLYGHESTVTTIKFSPDNKFISTGGKDRTLGLFSFEDIEKSLQRKESHVSDNLNHSLESRYLWSAKNAHKRIIWDSSWSDSSRHLVTCSRDGVCKVWEVTSTQGLSQLKLVASFQPFGSVSVTSIDLTAAAEHVKDNDESYYVASGSENGEIQVSLLNISVSSDINNIETKNVIAFPTWLCHGVGKSVRRLRWAPSSRNFPDIENFEKLLASCGDDHSVRIFKLSF